MFGPGILVRTLSTTLRSDKFGNQWQYMSRSDHHSKVACWGIIFDLLRTSPLLRRHVETGAVGFGINHEMRDFVHDRKKDLDLVVCTRRRPIEGRKPKSLLSMVHDYSIVLSLAEQQELEKLPLLEESQVGGVLLALEAKACMTAHQRCD